MIVKICGITRPDDMTAAIAAGVDWIGLNFFPGSRRFVTAAQGRALAEVARLGALREDGAGTATPERVDRSLRSTDVKLVGVFVNQPVEHMISVAAEVGLDMVQLHGDASEYRALTERGVAVIRSIAMTGEVDVQRVAQADGDLLLIDTPTPDYGGSGQTFDWALAQRAVATGKRIVLAGGLNPSNVADAVTRVRPYGVDVASGVESAPGIKDPAAMAAFITAARSAS